MSGSAIRGSDRGFGRSNHRQLLRFCSRVMQSGRRQVEIASRRSFEVFEVEGGSYGFLWHFLGGGARCREHVVEFSQWRGAPT